MNPLLLMYKKHIKTSQDHQGYFLTHFTFHPGVQPYFRPAIHSYTSRFWFESNWIEFSANYMHFTVFNFLITIPVVKPAKFGRSNWTKCRTAVCKPAKTTVEPSYTGPKRNGNPTVSISSHKSRLFLLYFFVRYSGHFRFRLCRKPRLNRPCWLGQRADFPC